MIFSHTSIIYVFKLYIFSKYYIVQHFDVLIFSNPSLTACVRATSRAQPSIRQPGACRCLRREAPHPFARKPGSLRAESGQYSEMDHLNNPFFEIYLFKTFLTFYAEFPQILFRIYENVGILASLFSKSLIFGVCQVERMGGGGRELQSCMEVVPGFLGPCHRLLLLISPVIHIYKDLSW